MGKRRLGFLTSWQEEYVLGHERVSEDRERVENHYILKSLEKAIEQFGLIDSWLVKKAKIKASDSDALRKAFFSLRGRKPKKYYSFSKTLTCPICHRDFMQHFTVSKDKVVATKGGATFGLPYEKKERRDYSRNGE
jgi:hypothetical protein